MCRFGHYSPLKEACITNGEPQWNESVCIPEIGPFAHWNDLARAAVEHGWVDSEGGLTEIGSEAVQRMVLERETRRDYLVSLARASAGDAQTGRSLAASAKADEVEQLRDQILGLLRHRIRDLDEEDTQIAITPRQGGRFVIEITIEVRGRRITHRSTKARRPDRIMRSVDRFAKSQSAA